MARVVPLNDERGQLLLIGAIGLGVLFVMLALVLNTAIFTDALAAHDETLRDGRTVGHATAAVEHGIGGLIEYVNAHNATSHEALTRNLSAGIADWDHLTARQLASRSAVTNVSLVSVTNGTRIVQDTAANDGTVRPFTNESGTANWTLATSVGNTRAVRLNVTQPENTDDEGTCTQRSDCYALAVTNDSANETWQLFVYASDEDDGNITVWVRNASGAIGQCTRSRQQAWINVTAGTVAGTECQPLVFAEGVMAPYTISYSNADAIAGTYTLTVDTAVATTPHYSSDPSRSPRLAPAVYSATVEFTYRTADLRYTTQLRIVPGDRDA